MRGIPCSRSWLPGTCRYATLQRAPLADAATWQTQRDAEAAERAEQAQERHTVLNAAVAAIVPLQSQQDLALLAANVADTLARGLGAELQQRHRWDGAAEQACQAERRWRVLTLNSRAE